MGCSLLMPIECNREAGGHPAAGLPVPLAGAPEAIGQDSARELEDR
jgi:hypothetical protein